MTDDAHEADDVAPETVGGDEPEQAYGCLVSYSNQQKVLHPHKDGWQQLASDLLRDGWNMCVDVTAVDFLTYSGRRSLPPTIAPERFEVVAGFISHERRDRIRARTQVPADDPTIGSLYEIFPGTDTLEREVYDMFGIVFEGHPDLSRILMPEHWEGHPLRKDFATGAIPVQFKGAPAAR
jgi:NADH-quinone oxidoreductase subunit C